MTVVADRGPPPRAGLPPSGPRPGAPARLAAALAGPALVVVSVLFVLRDHWLDGRFTSFDVRFVWLPFGCFLGDGLAAGHVPAWNPFLFAGAPFAADPQSGWMNLSVMALVTALPCDAAIRWMVVLHPIVAGLGLLWFLRIEGTGRAAAAAGGVALALAVAVAELAVSLPLAGALAWSALLLAVTARWVRAAGWPGRLAWTGAAGLVAGQLAASHLSVGLVSGLAVVAAALGAAVAHRIRRGTWTGLDAAARVGVLVVAVALLNLAILVPRLAYASRTNLALGYGTLQALGERVSGAGAPGPQRIGGSAGPAWPLELAVAGGATLGAALLVASAGWWDRRRRHLVAAFSAVALLAYVLSLGAVARAVPGGLASWRLVDLYLHAPEWAAYPGLLALAAMAGLGLDAVLRAGGPRRRLRMLAPGLLVWAAVPLLAGVDPARMLPLALAAAAGAIVLVGSGRRPWLAMALPVVVAVELGAGWVLWRSDPSTVGDVPSLLSARPAAAFDPAQERRPGPLAEGLRRVEGRYAVLARPEGFRAPGRPPATLANHGMLAGLESAGGYDPVQPLRTWIFVRAAQGRDVRYNRAAFVTVPPVVRDLLQVNAVLAPGPPPAPFATVAAREDGYLLGVAADAVPRASVLTRWRVVDAGDDARPLDSPALEAVLDPAFDPAQEVILEEDPGVPGTGGEAGGGEAGGGEAGGGRAGGGRAAYAAEGLQAARVVVETDVPAIVLVRTAWDPNWHARVDGRETPVLRADYLLQGVAVPAGRHVIELRYDDPWIGAGLLGSGAAAALLLAAIAGVSAAERRQPRAGPEVPG